MFIVTAATAAPSQYSMQCNLVCSTCTQVFPNPMAKRRHKCTAPQQQPRANPRFMRSANRTAEPFCRAPAKQVAAPSQLGSKHPNRFRSWQIDCLRVALLGTTDPASSLWHFHAHPMFLEQIIMPIVDELNDQFAVQARISLPPCVSLCLWISLLAVGVCVAAIPTAILLLFNRFNTLRIPCITALPPMLADACPSKLLAPTVQRPVLTPIRCNRRLHLWTELVQCRRKQLTCGEQLVMAISRKCRLSGVLLPIESRRRHGLEPSQLQILVECSAVICMLVLNAIDTLLCPWSCHRAASLAVVRPVFYYQLQVLRSALHEAVLYGHLHVAEALLEAKAPIDTLDAVTSLQYGMRPPVLSTCQFSVSTSTFSC